MDAAEDRHRRVAEAVDKFEELVPVVDARRFKALTTWPEVEALAAERAPLGFMRYWSADIP